jgi:hypothetical protein
MAGTTKGSLVETSEVLNRAADLIEERGWVRGQGWPGVSSALTGEVYEGTALCLEGGVMAALGVSGHAGYDAWFHCPARVAVQEYLAIGQTAPFHWNDREGRTVGEVIEVLRACALIEAAREEQDVAWETYADVVSA